MDSRDANSDAPTPRFRGWRFSLRAGLIAVTVACLLIGASVLAVKARRDHLQRLATTNDFKSIALALHNYHEGRKCFPYPVRYARGAYRRHPSRGAIPEPPGRNLAPEARALHSWRLSAAPYFCNVMSEFDFDAPWDSPENKAWRYYMMEYGYDSIRPGMTKAFAITGPGTAFGDGLTERPKRLSELDSDTILLVEVRNSKIPWIAPGDFDIRDMPRTINDPSGTGISSAHETGFHVAFADAVVWYLSNDVPFTELEKFFTVGGARRYNREKVLRRFVIR